MGSSVQGNGLRRFRKKIRVSEGWLFLRFGGIGVSETTQKMEHNRPDVVVVDRVNKLWVIVDFSVPWDKNVESQGG